MTVVVVAPRAVPFIDLVVAKSALRVEHNDHDTLIADHVEACAAWLDGPTGVLGLAIGPQTLRLERAGFGGPEGYELPCGPVTDIESISYRDIDGQVQAVDAGVYELAANRVRLAHGQSWPSGTSSPVSVEYLAGYPENALPASIRNAALLHLKILYDQPHDKALEALERARDDLLSPLRRRRV